MSGRKRPPKPSAADYVSGLDPPDPTQSSQPAPKQEDAPSKFKTKRSRRKLTLYLEIELLEQARACVVTLGMLGEGAESLSQLHNEALRHELERLADEYNGGEAWPRYQHRLPSGRRPSR